jgi:hypothetical protein
VIFLKRVGQSCKGEREERATTASLISSIRAERREEEEKKKTSSFFCGEQLTDPLFGTFGESSLYFPRTGEACLR